MKTSKKAVSLIVSAIILLSACLFAGAESTVVTMRIGEPFMTLNENRIPIDENGTVPVIKNGRTLIPARAVTEALGGEAVWDGETKTAVFTANGSELRMTAGSAEAYLNGEIKTTDTPPVIENGRILLPIRFIAESFGFHVEWNGEEKEVKISKSSEQRAARLLYQGQGSVRIKTGEGKVIYIDPYAGEGYDLTADLILVTHAHRDHTALEKIENRSEDCAVITWREALEGGVHQSFDLGYVRVEAVEAGYNKNHSVEECVGYVLTLSDGIKVYLSGDTSTTLQMPEMKNMNIDYAFFCCDGKFNMDTAEAAKCAETVGAAHNIPYHTGGGEPKHFDIGTAEKFNAPNRLIIDAGGEIELK